MCEELSETAFTPNLPCCGVQCICGREEFQDYGEFGDHHHSQHDAYGALDTTASCPMYCHCRTDIQAGETFWWLTCHWHQAHPDEPLPMFCNPVDVDAQPALSPYTDFAKYSDFLTFPELPDDPDPSGKDDE